MNVTITKIVREFTLDVEPTVVLNGTYYEDGSFHLDRRGRQVVTSAKVRVTEGEQPFVQLFGSNLNADGTRSKRGQGEVWVSPQELITRSHIPDETTFTSDTTDEIEAAVLAAVQGAL